MILNDPHSYQDFQLQAESKAILMPQQKILIDVLFYWKMDWSIFLVFMKDSWSTGFFPASARKDTPFSGFFFQVKEVLLHLFQLKQSIQFSAEIFWQALEHVRDSRWNDVCRMFPEDRAEIPGCKGRAPGSNALMLRTAVKVAILLRSGFNKTDGMFLPHLLKGIQHTQQFLHVPQFHLKFLAMRASSLDIGKFSSW